MAKRDIGSQRREYVAEPLRRASLADNPFDQFSAWYQDAEKYCTGYPNPMVLSTVDQSGQPYSRVVLLKSFDDQGFVFYSNYESSKAMQMEQNSQVSLLFFWEPLERQVAIRGTVEKHSSAAADEYFASRPRGSQIGAWASKQSRPVKSREILEQQFRELDETYQEQSIPRPDNWGGYLVRPNSIEFWQGQPDRMHDRLVYSLKSQDSNLAWEIERLSP